MKLNTETFLERARQVHGDRYDYSRTVYKRSTEKVEIICREHGPFLQRPENHVNQKQDCPQCANKRKGKQERFSVEWMMQRPERAYAPALIYVAEVLDKRGGHIEVGVSTKSIKHSFKAKPNTTLLHMQYMSLKQALLVEEEIKNTLSDHAQNPTEFFSAKTKRLKNLPAVRALLEAILNKTSVPS